MGFAAVARWSVRQDLDVVAGLPAGSRAEVGQVGLAGVVVGDGSGDALLGAGEGLVGLGQRVVAFDAVRTLLGRLISGWRGIAASDSDRHRRRISSC